MRKIVRRKPPAETAPAKPAPKIVGKPDPMFKDCLLVNVKGRPDLDIFKPVSQNVPQYDQTFYRYDKLLKKVHCIVTVMPEGQRIAWGNCGKCHSLSIDQCTCPAISAPGCIRHIYEVDMAKAKGFDISGKFTATGLMDFLKQSYDPKELAGYIGMDILDTRRRDEKEDALRADQRARLEQRNAAKAEERAKAEAEAHKAATGGIKVTTGFGSKPARKAAAKPAPKAPETPDELEGVDLDSLSMSDLNAKAAEMAKAAVTPPAKAPAAKKAPPRIVRTPKPVVGDWVQVKGEDVWGEVRGIEGNIMEVYYKDHGGSYGVAFSDVGSVRKGK